uniref:Uncharacterized protein n=1 Tax=viral metagenome TaxID=1070528 RepID=A0A6H2A0H1_9ZZZZ
MSRAEQVCRELVKKGKWTKSQCELCRRLHKETCQILTEQNNLHPIFKDICDSFQRDYARAVNAEMNDSEHRRIR